MARHEQRGKGQAETQTTHTVVFIANTWCALCAVRFATQQLRDPDESSDSSTDDVPQVMVKAALSFGYQDDHLLFGSSGVDVSSLHPDPVRMFRLWQCYLECVDPLLKVTHSPTLQSRIVEAASHVDSIPPALEALMFSIYFITVMTLEPDECRATFGSSKRDLLASYRFGCQQALTNAGFLQSKDRDCLTALFLYLVSPPSSTLEHRR